MCPCPSVKAKPSPVNCSPSGMATGLTFQGVSSTAVWRVSDLLPVSQTFHFACRLPSSSELLILSPCMCFRHVCSVAAME